MNHLCSPAYFEKAADFPAKDLKAVSSRAANQPQVLRTVAFVDDDEYDRTTVGRLLGESGQFRAVNLYSAAEEALREVLREEPQVVLMDIRMPGMSGLECARKLRNIRPQLVIILISGFDQTHITAQALEAGADAYFPKPFSFAQFHEILTDCLRCRNLEVKETQFQSPLQSTRQGLWVEQPAIREALHRLVVRMEGNSQAQEDLFQEARVYLWSREQEYPGHPPSWYLQAVKFFLQNLRTCGRSVDSPKRRSAQVVSSPNSDRLDESLDSLQLGEGPMSEINARDIRSLLIDRLEPLDQSILVALEEGWASREVAERLQMSHESVRRHRNKIAAAALKLGIVQL